METTHLNYLELGLHNERQRLAAAKSEGERQQRQVWVSQLEREVAAERKFLGLPEVAADISDDELLAELGP